MENDFLMLVETLNPTLVALVIISLLVWTFIWKGLALWAAARAGHKGWFVALLLINTLGLLEILYLYVFKKRSENTEVS